MDPRLAPAPPRLGPSAPAPVSRPAAPLPPDTATAVERAFGAASERLLGWPQEIGGAWIERPELKRLRALALADTPAVTVLLGEPGVGKSALLARLGLALRGDGVALLALKADQLPRDIASLDALDRDIGAPLPVADALRRLAAERRTLLLIDQLDALADLMDLHSGRLGALLRLAHELRDTPNLAIILSCRAFEFRHDPRLATLRADAVTLGPPPWDLVKPLLDARGVSSDGWNDEVRETLRTPQHLALFVEHLAALGDPAFASYHAMLDAVVERLIQRHGPRVVEAAEQVAIAMAEDEELSLGKARFASSHGAELAILEREGVLRVTGPKIAFRHQTMFDFLRSRAFLRNGTSLAAFVIAEKQESLFVRPTLWSALTYLRANDRAAYKREFRQLWGHAGLRPHLRELLAAFLGQVGDPDDEEARWLLPRLDDDALRRRTLNAMAGRVGWFARMTPRLPTLMGAAPNTAWETVWFLSRALDVAADDVVGLVDRHWSRDPAFAQHAVEALKELRDWDDRRVDLAARVVGRADVVAFTVRRLAKRLSETRPDRAAALILANLQARLDRALAEPGGRERFNDVERMMDSPSDWHDLDQLAAPAPRAFLETLWPWLVRVMEALASEPNPALLQYRLPPGLSFQDDEDDGLREHPLPNALRQAARGFALAEPDGYLAFVNRHKHHDLMVLHHLLAVGLTAIADVRPRAVLAHLLEDQRRLAIGNFHDGHKDSKRLIAALAPALEPDDMRLLEDAIIGWERYAPFIPGDDAKLRHERRKWARERRLRLLRAIPGDRMTERGRRHRAEEERAFPHARDCDVDKIQLYRIDSPVPDDQMPRLSDDAIVALFNTLTDDTGWDHPKRRFGSRTGGSVQASRAFEALAKGAPDRALRLIDRFQAGRQERPTGAALRAIAENKTAPSDALIPIIHDLDARGFASEEFRWDAARSLASVAARRQGLPDATLNLLEGWLTDWQAPHPAEATEKPDQAEKREDSVLWGRGGIMRIPHGNFPALDALADGFLHREPMDVDGWLKRLERHLERREDPAVWTALSNRLPLLAQADRPQSLAFLNRLFERYPDILACRAGALLIAHSLDWLPTDRLSAVLDGWIDGPWSTGPQAAAEVATLAFCRAPNDPDHRRRVERFIAAVDHSPALATSLRLGVARTLAQAWREPSLRRIATELLLTLIPHTKDGPTARALSALVDHSDALPPDDDTRRILNALARHRHLLTAGNGHFIGHRLKDLLVCGFDPDLVCTVASAIVDALGDAIPGHRSGWSIETDDLVDIALALHRLPETRSRGLGVFERLLLLGVNESDGRLKDLDRQPFSG